MLFRKNKKLRIIKQLVFRFRKTKRKSSLSDRGELAIPTGRLPNIFGKVSFCTSYWKKNIIRASIAVETILVLPVFFLGIVTMISFMDIYELQTEHLVKLCENAKTAGMYAYVLDESGPKEVSLPDIYSYKPIGGLISLPAVRSYNLVTVHAWTGKTYESGTAESEEIEEMVYMTEAGSVYHKDLGCSYLSVSVTEVSGKVVGKMVNDYGNYYGACESCSRGQDPAAVVYVTQKGNSYHNKESCSALKRTVRMVKHSCTEGMAACSRCG